MSDFDLPTIKRTPLSIIIGLVGGLLFCAIYEGFQFFHFIEKKTLMPDLGFLNPSWQKGILPHLFWWVMICSISIIWALLYQWLVKLSDSMWPGIMINVGIFAIIFGLLGWGLEIGPDVRELKHHAIISLACLFVLHGAFVGFSISYDEPYAPDATPNEQ